VEGNADLGWKVALLESEPTVEPADILREARNRANDARSVERTVDSEEFRAAWAAASEEQKVELLALIRKIDRIGLEALVRTIAKKSNLMFMTLMELREVARQRGITMYTHKSKAELVSEISQCKTS
jgi:hypothetical protein